MGARVSTKNEGRSRSDAIDRQIREESRNCRKVNILLLGTDPEKSMIVKQMKIQHGLTNDEMLHYRLTIYQNCLDSAKALVRAIRDMNIEYDDSINQIEADYILDYSIQHTFSFVFSTKIAEAIHRLWQDPIIPKVMDHRNKFWLGESAEYFFEEILRIGSPDYIPTDSDILRAQESLLQVIETRFPFGALQASIIDVGKRHLFKRWIHYFDDITCIIFCVSLGDYDQVFLEDDSQNLLNDSFIVFESAANSRWFTRTSIILLLTNIDVFRDKLSKVPLERYFPQYTGGADVDKALGYIRLRFMQVNRARLPTYFIQHQVTNSTIPRSIFGIVKETVLEDAWKDFKRTPSRSTAIHVLRLYRIFSSVRS